MVYLSVKQWQTYGVAIILEIPLLCIGVAGIWRGRSFWVLVPAVLAWLALAGITLFLGSPQYFLAAIFVASLTLGVWVGLRRRRTELLAIKQFAASMNRLGWTSITSRPNRQSLTSHYRRSQSTPGWMLVK
jgi:hypothetical protein